MYEGGRAARRRLVTVDIATIDVATVDIATFPWDSQHRDVLA